MRFIEYFSLEDKEYWLGKISQSDWSAAKYLAFLLKEKKLDELVGANAHVLLLVDGDDIVSLCTLAKYDDVQPTDLTPWIGWVYTFPQYRGRRFAGKLLEHAEAIAKEDGAGYTHVSTNHIGLYEKYGYEFLSKAKDVEGEDTRIYRKKI